MPNLPEATLGRKVRPKAKTASVTDTSDTGSATADVASYVSEISAQLETMALGAGLDLLAYFLRLAQFEARSTLRTAQTQSAKKAPRSDVGEYKSGDE
jgi:hypothetical protein